MRQYICDLCGRETTMDNLKELNELAQVEGVKDVCEICYKEIEELNWKIITGINGMRWGWLRKFIKKMKAKTT